MSIARATKLAAPLLLLLALAGCFQAHPNPDGTVTYATRPAFYWTMLGGFVFFVLVAWASIRQDPGDSGGWMLLLASTAPLGAMFIGVDNRWTVGPDGFAPPRRFTLSGPASVRYADIERIEVVSKSTGKGQLHDWDFRLRSRPGVMRLSRPDDPVRQHLEREFQRHGIAMTSRDAGLWGGGLMFVVKIFAGVAIYAVLAGLLATWAGRRAKRKQVSKSGEPKPEGEAT